MKVFFIAVILMHGIIHLIGFLKAFEIAEISQLTEDISKPIGSLWLLVTLLFLLVIILVILNQDWWWLPAIIATVISQYLIILSWQDAKFGTILNIIILIAIVIGFAVWQINTQTNKKIDLLLTKTKSEEVIVTNEMLEDLPSSVKQWLSKSGMVGKNKIQTVYFKQKGLMKLNPDQKNGQQLKLNNTLLQISLNLFGK